MTLRPPFTEEVTPDDVPEIIDHSRTYTVRPSVGIPVTVTACSSTEGGNCEQFAKCNVRDPLWRISDIIVSALSKTTVSELASDMSPAAERTPVRIVAAPVRA